MLLGWSYGLTFPLEGILEVIMLNKTINKATVHIIIIIDVDIFLIIIRTICYLRECIIKMIVKTI